MTGRLSTLGVSFLVAFTLWTHIAPQIAQWRFYYTKFDGTKLCNEYVEVDRRMFPDYDGDYMIEQGKQTYAAEYMWSKLEWDFYYVCEPVEYRE
jgi:hypothetical protein